MMYVSAGVRIFRVTVQSDKVSVSDNISRMSQL